MCAASPSVHVECKDSKETDADPRGHGQTLPAAPAPASASDASAAPAIAVAVGQWAYCAGLGYGRLCRPARPADGICEVSLPWGEESYGGYAKCYLPVAQLRTHIPLRVRTFASVGSCKAQTDVSGGAVLQLEVGVSEPWRDVVKKIADHFRKPCAFRTRNNSYQLVRTRTNSYQPVYG